MIRLYNKTNKAIYQDFGSDLFINNLIEKEIDIAAQILTVDGVEFDLSYIGIYEKSNDVLVKEPVEIKGNVEVNPIAIKTLPGFDAANDKLIIGNTRDKFRCSFFDLSDWDITQIGNGMTVQRAGLLNGSSYLNINSGINVSVDTIIQSKKSFKLPLKVSFAVSMSQRIANSEFYVELVSIDANGAIESDITYPSTNSNNALNVVSFKFDGTSANNAIYLVRGFGISELVSASSAFGTGLTTATGVTPNFLAAFINEINVDMEQAIFSAMAVDSLNIPTGIFKRTQNLPDPAKEYKIRIRAKNLVTAPASATDFRLHFIRVIDTTRLTVDWSKNMGRNTDAASALPVIFSSGGNSVIASFSSAQSVQLSPSSTLGGLIYKLNSAASINATAVKASAAILLSLMAYNTSASVRYLKLYNKATAPAPATDTPVMVIALPPASNTLVPISAYGIRFATGLSFCIVAGITDTDVTAIGLNEVVLSLSYA